MLYFWHGQCPSNRLSPRGPFLDCFVELQLVFLKDGMSVCLILNLHEVDWTAFLLLHKPLFRTWAVENVLALCLEQLFLVVDYAVANLTSWLFLVAHV